MAAHTNKPHPLTNPKPPSTTATATVSFGGFFGCSDVNSVAIIKVAATDPQYSHKTKNKDTKKKETNKKIKKKPWFPNWSKKKPPVAATVETPPFESSSPNSKKDDNLTKSSGFSKSKFTIKWKTTRKNRHTPAVTSTVDTAEIDSAAAAGELSPSDGAIDGEPVPEETITTGSPEQDNLVLGIGNANSKHRPDEEKPPNIATCKKRFSFCRTKAETKNGPGSSISQPGSPVSNSNPNGTVSISRSTTFPAPDYLNPEQVQLQPGKKMAAAAGRSRREKERGKLDSVVGLSIIAVTLVIMVIWGRICAIVCTSAWLYFIPRLRTTLSEVKVKAKRGKNVGGSGGGGAGEFDLDSVEYKRRVVLEGLLERKRRLLA
ncbi:Uncharacterized protein At5g23160 [Linum perenne]